MGRSLHISGNFVFKLHIAALESLQTLNPNPPVMIYPVMDGFYACCPNQANMLSFLSNIFEEAASEFISETQPLHRFIIRGALAFGPVMHGDLFALQQTRQDDDPWRRAIERAGLDCGPL